MKKLLIITYYWPPSGGGGVQRWLKFSKYLPGFNWQPVIFTPENPDFSIDDPSLLRDVPTEAEVLKFPIWEPYSVFDKLFGKNRKKRSQGVVNGDRRKTILSEVSKWIRGNIFIPDPKVFWVRPSVDFLENFIRDNSIQHIVTTGPPHSIHLIGLKLKKRTGVSWIADFRDPWSRWDMLDNFHLSGLARKTHKKMESKVILNADRVLTVSNTWAAEIEEDYGKKAIVITNGFDSEDFPDVSILKPDKFIISHSGLINDFRNPGGLWEVLKELCKENKDFYDSLQIEFCGTIDPIQLEEITSDPILNSKFKFRNYLPHDEVMNLYKSSSVLLLLLNKSKNASGHLPGKLFEYLASNRFILTLGDAEGEASGIIAKTGSGTTCDPDDLSCIKKTISSFFTHFKNGNFPDSNSRPEYSRKALTKGLVEVLEEL